MSLLLAVQITSTAKIAHICPASLLLILRYFFKVTLDRFKG